MRLHSLFVLLALMGLSPAWGQETDLLGTALVPWPIQYEEREPVVIEVAAGDDLQAVIDLAPEGAELWLAAGDYVASPQPYLDPLCGNCLEHRTPVQATTGFVIRGRSLKIIGPSEGIATLHTRAGYGVFIEDAPEVELLQLTITDGQRDNDGRATDGAVVVRNSRVLIEACVLGPNPVPDRLLKETVVGICGVVGREESEIEVRDSIITRNTWDGVACYRGAVATLTDVQIAAGRGAGVGITWNSVVTATRVQVSDYWKGIGSFGNSVAVIRNCLIHDVRGWGLIASGASQMTAANCTIVRCGNVGIARWNEESQLALANCISWGNGTTNEWVAPRVGLWWNGDREAQTVRYCLFGNNAEGEFQWGTDGTAGRAWSLVGQRGNRHGHPLYRAANDWTQVIGSSPIIDGGDPAIRDRDGSVSDLGWTGGPEGTNP